VFDDRNFITLPTKSEYPNIQAGICVCWEMMNFPKISTVIKKMGYHVNYMIPCIHRRSFRLAHGQSTAPKTTYVTLVTFSGVPGQRLTWFSLMAPENKDLTFPFVVSKFAFLY